MTKQLDDKVLKLLHEYHNFAEACESTIKSDEDAIVQIKQAFADEEYVQIPQVEMVTKWERGMDKPELFMVNGKEVMTGQEWFSSFEKELQTILNNTGVEDNYHYAREAAKRAAGLSNE